MTAKDIADQLPLDRIIAIKEYPIPEDLSENKKMLIEAFQYYYRDFVHLSTLLKANHSIKTIYEEIVKTALKIAERTSWLETITKDLSIEIEKNNQFRESYKKNREAEINMITEKFINYINKMLIDNERLIESPQKILESLIYILSMLLGYSEWWSDVYTKIHPYLEKPFE